MKNENLQKYDGEEWELKRYWSGFYFVRRVKEEEDSHKTSDTMCGKGKKNGEKKKKEEKLEKGKLLTENFLGCRFSIE